MEIAEDKYVCFNLEYNAFLLEYYAYCFLTKAIVQGYGKSYHFFNKILTYAADHFDFIDYFTVKNT